MFREARTPQPPARMPGLSTADSITMARGQRLYGSGSRNQCCSVTANQQPRRHPTGAPREPGVDMPEAMPATTANAPATIHVAWGQE